MHGVDRLADVLRRPEAEDLHLERVEIDLDLRDVAAPRVARVGVAAVGVVVPLVGRVAGLVLHELAQRAPVAKRSASAGAGEVVGHRRREPLVSAANARTRSPISFAPRATIEPTTMTVRDATVGPESGTLVVLGVSKAIAVDGHARGVGGELAEHGLGPLPDVGRGRADAEPPARLEVDPHLAFELPLAGAGEARAVEEDARADAAPRARAVAFVALLRVVLRALLARTRSPPCARVTHSSTPTLSRSTCPVTVVDPSGHRALALERERLPAELRGEPVHVPLDGPDRLRRAEPAEGAVRRRVRRDGDPLDRARASSGTRPPRAGCRATARPA